MISRSRSDCTAKAQSKATALQITRSATQGFCCTNTGRSALSLAKRQVGQRLWKKFKTHSLYLALVSSLHCSHSSCPESGLLQTLVQLWVRSLEFSIFPARTSPGKSQSHGLFRPAQTSSTHTDVWWAERKKGRDKGADRLQTKKIKRQNKQKQTKRQKNPSTQ